MEAERLQKVLARAGMGSRRSCERLIEDGRVRVNGQIARLGSRANPSTDRIEVDGTVVPTAPELTYLLLNKPAGYVTTADDPEGRPTVLDLVRADDRVFAVGRLDIDTEGLILLTNDGEFANLMMHPTHGVEKTYLAEVTGHLDRDAVASLRKGIDLDDGRTATAEARIVGRVEGRKLVEIRIREGKNRQVRRMVEAVGGKVARLVRTRIGTLTDRSLKPGKWRRLSTAEVRDLLRTAGDERPK